MNNIVRFGNDNISQIFMTGDDFMLSFQYPFHKGIVNLISTITLYSVFQRIMVIGIYKNPDIYMPKQRGVRAFNNNYFFNSDSKNMLTDSIY